MAYNQYESDDMMLSISQIPKPPLYSEALTHPIMPYNEPPPPYSPKSTPTSVMSPELEVIQLKSILWLWDPFILNSLFMNFKVILNFKLN